MTHPSKIFSRERLSRISLSYSRLRTFSKNGNRRKLEDNLNIEDWLKMDD